jgi:WD40 repeat protein
MQTLTLSDPSEQTSDFYSSPKDRLDLPQGHGYLAFSMASFHDNSLVAMGLESGRILLQDTLSEDTFRSPYLFIDAHSNAVMDLDISADDSMIASASGDQVAKIIDVTTRRVKARFDFEQACGTLKQIRFQPGNPHVIATSCREGFINIWDMRCHGKAQVESKASSRPMKPGPLRLKDEPSTCTTYATTFLSIPNAHGDRSLLASGSHLTL